MTSNEAVNRHDMDTVADAVFAGVALDHPEAVSTDETYPGWTPDAGNGWPFSDDWPF